MNRRVFLELAGDSALSITALSAVAEGIVVNQKQLSTQTLFAKWYCQLNSWKWPEEWGECPYQFSEIERVKYLGPNFTTTWPGWDTYRELINGIKAVAGERECSRYWNVVYQKK